MSSDENSVLKHSFFYQLVSTIWKSPNDDSTDDSKATGKTIISTSVLYRTLTNTRGYIQHSRVVQKVNNPHVLSLGAVAVVLISLLRILTSGLHVTVKFLSFALLAVLLLVLVWPYTKPLADG